MANEEFSFSSDNKKISRKDLDKTSKISEEYFGMKQDPNQIQASSKNRDWIYKNTPDYLNIIRSRNKIIGYAFLLPCNKTLMDNFVNGRIDEATLFESIKKIKLKGIPDTIYLCAAIVKENFRGNGLATSAFVKAINKITHKGKIKPTLFYWRYSNEGEKLANKISRITKLKLKERID